MTDERKEAAGSYADNENPFHGTVVNAWGEREVFARQQLADAHLAGQEHTIDKLRAAVNEECSCGGCGPDDPQACQACMVWHRVTGGEG